MALRIAQTVLVLLVVALGSRARAQEGWPAPTAAELTEAQRQFELGVAEYEAGRLEDALVRFVRAHALSRAPELLYNLATVHERLRHDAEALDAYGDYLEAVPDCADRATIEARVRVLAGELEGADATTADGVAKHDEAVASPSIVTSDAIDAPTSSGSDPAPWVLTAVGAAVLAGGGALVAIAAIDASTVETASSWTDAQAAYDRAPAVSGSGIAALGVGAATMIAGIVWGASPSSTPGHVAVGLGPGSISLSGSF